MTRINLSEMPMKPFYFQHSTCRRKIPNYSRYGCASAEINLPHLERPMTPARELNQYHDPVHRDNRAEFRTP